MVSFNLLLNCALIRANKRSGRLGGRCLHCADGGSGRRADRWIGRLGADEPWLGGLGGWADGQMGRRAGGPGFKRPHSTRPTSLLGAPSACVVRARVRRAPGSEVGSSRIPRQTPVLSARTHLPRLSMSVLGAEKGILLSAFKKLKMDLTQGDGRGTPNRRQAAHAPRDKDGDGGKKKHKVADLELDVFHNLELLAYLGWEQQPQPWSVATAMKYVGFPHFDRLWPPTSHEQHCKSRDAKYLHLEDVEVKWRFLTILRAISEQTKWPKGSIPRSIASMMYAEHVLRVDVDWSTFRTEGFGAIGPGLLAKRPIHIPYVPVPEWFRNDSKLYMDPRAQERTTRTVGGPNGLMEVADMQVMVFHSRNGSHLRGWLPRWQRGCRRMSMPRWRHCANSTTSMFRPTRLELSTSKQSWHLLEFVNL